MDRYSCDLSLNAFVESLKAFLKRRFIDLCAVKMPEIEKRFSVLKAHAGDRNISFSCIGLFVKEPAFAVCLLREAHGVWC